MGGFDALTAELRDALRRRQIQRVIYTHCDVWQPWRTRSGSHAISAQNRDEILRFVDASRTAGFAASYSLFYETPIHAVFESVPYLVGGQKCHAADDVHFVARHDAQQAMAREALSYVATSGMDVQVHIQYAALAHNAGHSRRDAEAFLASAKGQRFEDARFALLVKLSLARIRQETGLSLDRWFYAHGKGGLNASDPSICYLTREIAILMEQGCRGDVTGPAWRTMSNPRLEVPYFITPVDAPKGYDLQDGAPELAYGNRTAGDRGKFLIWSSVIKHRGASLDYYAPWLRTRLDDVRSHAREIIAQSYAVDGTLFIKSHAHSMHPNYYLDTPQAVFPHQHPPIRNLFGAIFDAASAADCRVEFKSVSELYDLMTTAVFEPSGGFGLTIPGTAPMRAGPIATGVPCERPLTLRTPLATPQPTSVRKAPAPAPSWSALVDDVAVEATAARVPAEPIVHGSLIGLTGRTVVKSLIEEFGRDHLGEAFLGQAREGSLLTRDQDQLVRVLTGLGRYRSYQDVGCGVGVMAVAMAASGLPTVGIDTHHVRIRGARRILEAVIHALSGQSKSLAAPCEFLHATFPEAVAHYDVSTSLACVSNLLALQPSADAGAVAAGLARYGAVVLDLQRFDRPRRTRRDADALLWELQKAGLGPGRVVLDLGSNGRFAHFAPMQRR